MLVVVVALLVVDFIQLLLVTSIHSAIIEHTIGWHNKSWMILSAKNQKWVLYVCIKLQILRHRIGEVIQIMCTKC